MYAQSTLVYSFEMTVLWKAALISHFDPKLLDQSMELEEEEARDFPKSKAVSSQ